VSPRVESGDWHIQVHGKLLDGQKSIELFHGSIVDRDPVNRVLLRCPAPAVGVPNPCCEFTDSSCFTTRERPPVEPVRVFRRLHFLRGWGHVKFKQVFTGGAGAGGSARIRAS